MRVATIGKWVRWYSYFLAGTMEGSIRLGHKFCPIYLYDDVRYIDEQLRRFLPNVIFCHGIFNKDLDRGRLFDVLHLARERGSKVCVHFGDPKSFPRYDKPLNNVADFGLVNSDLYTSFSEILKIPCMKFPFFCLRQQKIPTLKRKYQITFTGNYTARKEGHIHYGRKEFLDRLSEKIPVKIFPDDTYRDTRFITPEVSAWSDVVIGKHQGWDIPGYLDTRPFQYIGAGALYFHDQCEEMDGHFVDKVHYVSYEKDNVDSVVEKYLYYVKENPIEGEQIRKDGFNFCQQYHNPEVRLRKVFQELGLG